MTEEGVIASLVWSFGEAISDCFASLATAKNAAGLLRRFAPRGDKVWVSLRGRRFALLLCHCEVVVSFPKQSRRLENVSFQRYPKEVVVCYIVPAVLS